MVLLLEVEQAQAPWLTRCCRLVRMTRGCVAKVAASRDWAGLEEVAVLSVDLELMRIS